MAAQEWRRREVKRCPACKRSLPVSMFGINSASHDGLMGYCRACERDRQTFIRHGEEHGAPNERVVRSLEMHNTLDADNVLDAHTAAIVRMHNELGLDPPRLP